MHLLASRGSLRDAAVEVDLLREKKERTARISHRMAACPASGNPSPRHFSQVARSTDGSWAILLWRAFVLINFVKSLLREWDDLNYFEKTWMINKLLMHSQNLIHFRWSWLFFCLIFDWHDECVDDFLLKVQENIVDDNLVFKLWDVIQIL